MTTASNRNSTQPRTIFLPWRWLLAGAVLLMSLGLGAIVALNIWRAEPPNQIWPGQLFARELARSTTQYPGVTLSSGVYLPDTGVILYSRVDFLTEEQVQIWAAGQLKAQVADLELMPSGQTLTWIIDRGRDSVHQTILRAPLAQAADTNTHIYFTLPPEAVTPTTPLPENPAPVETTTGIQRALSPEIVDPPAVEPVLAEPAPVITQPVATEPSNSSEPVNDDAPATTGGNPISAVSLDSTVFVSGFENEATGWIPMAGEWLVQDGRYQQSNATGFDYITMLETEPLTHYSLETRFRHIDGNLGAGLIYGAPNIDTRAGAGIVDVAENGSFLRWGYYDDDGAYTYQGGLAIDPPVDDGNWHSLRLVTRQEASTIYLDDQEISTFQNQNQGGYVGLVTSEARVEFDDVALLSIPAGEELSVLEIPLAQFEDNFEDGEADGWQALTGDWQVINNEYHQLNLEEANARSVSPFQGDAYIVQSRIKYVEGAMEAGFYYNMAQPDTLAQSQSVGYTAQGEALQWGHFDEAGNFVPEGQADIPPSADGEWHTLQIAVAEGQVTITLDGQPVAENLPLTYSSGYVGLYANNGHAAFDDIRMRLDTSQ